MPTVERIAARAPRAALVLVMTSLLATMAFGQAAGSGAASYRKPPGALVAPGEDPSLILLYTGDVIGNVDACG
jgi:hypothetical protein